MGQATQPLRRPQEHDDLPSQEELARSRADRRLRWVVLALLATLVSTLGVIALLDRDSGGTMVTGGSVPAATVLPAGVDAETFAVRVAPGVPLKPGAPQLEIWEDFQCPACAQTEVANGRGIVALARSGEALVLWRPTTFLDGRFPGSASLRATAAWGCAIDAGRAVAYHAGLFAAQPSAEGAGFSDAQLLSVGRASGIGGVEYARFRSCVRSGRYRGWAASSSAEFSRLAVPGTPTAFLDAHPLAAGVLASTRTLQSAVHRAAMVRSGVAMDMG